jgi:hypothetical protein
VSSNCSGFVITLSSGEGRTKKGNPLPPAGRAGS